MQYVLFIEVERRKQNPLTNKISHAQSLLFPALTTANDATHVKIMDGWCLIGQIKE